MGQPLSRIIDGFSRHSVASGRIMRDLLEADREAFFAEALPMLRSPSDAQGVQYLLTLLLLNDLILEPLVDPELFTFAEAVTLAKQLIRLEPMLDTRMIRSLIDSNKADSGSAADKGAEFEKKIGSAKGIRLLEIMANISDGARILPMMAQLLHHPNTWVRSKAALIVGRGNKNYKWVEQRLTEADPRVRANAIESLWGSDAEGSKNVFWGALTDADNRVVGNALLGLYLQGEIASVPLIFDLTQHEAEDFRSTGVWVMGETGDPRFRSSVARLLSDPGAPVRSSAFRAMAKLKQSQARYAAAPGVQVLIQRYEQPPAGWARVTAAVRTLGAAVTEPVPALRATQFLIQCRGQMVAEYEVEEVAHPETLVMSFAVPRLVEVDDPYHAQCERAFAQALTHRKRADQWMILKYLPEAEKDAASPGRNQFSLLQLDKTPDEAEAEQEAQREAQVPELRFFTDPAAVKAAASAAGTRLMLPRGIVQAARALLGPLSQGRGLRHLVILTTGAGTVTPNPIWTDLVRAAKSSRVAIHVIGMSRAPILESLVDRTGGFYSLVASAGELPAAIENLYVSLQHRYQIRFRIPDAPAPSANGAEPFALRVYCNQGTGEKLIAQPPMAASADVA